MSNLTNEELKLLRFLKPEKLKVKSTFVWNKKNAVTTESPKETNSNYKNANFKNDK